MIESVEALQGSDLTSEFLKIVSFQLLQCKAVVGLDLLICISNNMKKYRWQNYRVQEIMRASEKAVTIRMNCNPRDDSAASFFLILLVDER